MDINRVKHRVKDTNDALSKPRVFFAVHHDDQAEYLERIVRILQDQQSCIVYYYDFPEDHDGSSERATDRELDEILGDTQLIAAAVTMRMLREPSLAMDYVIPYAQAHNIPVLPLMMEPDPAGVFNRKFGDLQYLMPDDPDKTAEPFEKKLESYLSDVLVSAETAQRIRDAFDACVFLSYRKKDRTYARELMRMIHRDPRYRDIAFWYDEFLVPGEDFNDGISKALDDSDLFAMVVTPNLLEDPNYVMTHEYPAAQDLGKTIFPVEMDTTDESEMKRYYAGIPESVRAEEGDAWDRQLHDKLNRFILRTRSDEPQHTFLIGLAYLDGINMEVDTEQAVKLITEAGDAGLEEAMRKLSSMYYYGKGVRKSIAASTEWQQKLTDKICDRYRGDPTDELLEELYTEQNTLTNRIFRLKGDTRTVTEVSELMTLAEEKVRRGMKSARHDLAFSTCKLGSIFMHFDVFYDAKKYLERGIEEYEEFLPEEPSDKARKELSAAYRMLGGMLRSRNMIEETLDCYNRSIEILEEIQDEAFREAVSSSITGAYTTVGNILAQSGKLDEAAEMYDKAVCNALKTSPDKASYKEKGELADLYGSLAEFCFKKDDREGAFEYIRKEIGVRKMRLREAKESGIRYAGQYNTIALNYRLIREYDEASACYRMCLEAPEEDPDRPDVFEDHMSAYGGLGRIDRFLGNEEQAEKNFEEELRLARILAERTDSPKHIDRIAQCLEDNFRKDPDRLEEALMIRHELYMKLKIADYRHKRDGLCNFLESMKMSEPGRKRVRIGLLSNVNSDQLQNEKAILQAAGYKVARTGFGIFDLADFLEFVKPDLVIADSEYLRNDPRGTLKEWYETHLIRFRGKVPFLLILDERYRSSRLTEGEEAGEYYLLFKPYTSEELTDRVREITADQRKI